MENKLLGVASALLQKSSSHDPPAIAAAKLKHTFSAPPRVARPLINLATQPLHEQKPHIRATSDQANLPGYWISPFIASLTAFPAWEVEHGDYDVLLVYCHGGAWHLGHALMYSPWMTALVLARQFRLRIYSLEYALAEENAAQTHYPSQQKLLLHAYKTLLGMGVPATKLVLGGDSSGGFNALNCFEDICAERIPPPAGLLLNSPLVDLSLSKDGDGAEIALGADSSLVENEKKDYIGSKLLKNGLRAYQPPSSSAPLLHTPFLSTAMPATLIIYGTGEVLHDSIATFIGDLRKGSVDITAYNGFEEPHVFNVLEKKYSKEEEHWDEAMRVVVAWFARFCPAGDREEMLGLDLRRV